MPSVLPVLGNGIRGVAVNEQKQLQQKFGQAYHVERRPGYGWYICEGSRTMYGFDTRKLLRAYIERAVARGVLYTPAARETYR